MKKHSSIITILILISLNLYSDELSWVDQQIEAIKPPRKGVSNYEVSRIRDPFVFLSKSEKKKAVKRKSVKRKTKKVSISSKDTLARNSYAKLKLSAIINGSVLINGKWYKLNEKVYGYTVSKIKSTSVLLTSGTGRLILSTSDTKRNLKFK